MLPRVLLCGEIECVQDELKEMFHGIAEVIHLVSESRSHSSPHSGPVGHMKGLSPSDLSKVRWIAQSSSGYDAIDVQACKDRGIMVSNTPGANEDATATATLYLMLLCLRHFSMAERSLRSGIWRTLFNPAQTHDVTGRTLGIFGLGRIGLRFAHPSGGPQLHARES
ncbi:uncharacterized protein F5891DRAFT_1185402 [Suillus fuscotomentosus]|uniref:Uncharacterized protein n=1 Tax=Suillus fuscotomentosus TaxID=1912939 RepID=A0AAD4EBT0_9AGAM|nr:uncharacterized protein F5891DRAFT_1185402 [Suillus fuscotomentosus]KAG1903260.1 hypothetical protein F5891DRAFT_1185402 [Suillus fuscotomentosus]